MKKTLLPLAVLSISFFACKKEQFVQRQEACELQKDNPAGRSYASESVVPINYSKKQCGLLPLNSRNYWIYEDSVFNDGVFVNVQYDTLRYTPGWKSLSDNLIWWESSIALGIPERLYSTDSAFFQMEDRMFTPGVLDAKKDFALFNGDSILYLASFEDNAAQGRSVKIKDSYKTAAGSFDEVILFEKYARNFRKDQVFFKPGLGVVKYIREKAPMGTRVIKMQQVSTLVAFHIE